MLGGRRLGPICTAAVIHLAAAVPNFAWLEERLYPRRELRPGEPSDTNVAEERHDPRVYTQIPVRYSYLSGFYLSSYVDDVMPRVVRCARAGAAHR